VPAATETNPLPSSQSISTVLPFSAVYSIVGVLSFVFSSVELDPESLVVIRLIVFRVGSVVSMVMFSVWVVWLPAVSVVLTCMVLEPSEV